MSIESHKQFPHSSVDKGVCKYSPARASNIATQVSLILWLRVHFPMRYAYDNGCCDSPDARKCKVTASLSPDDIALRKFVFLCNTAFYPPKQMIESFRRHPNVPIEDV